MHTPVLLKEVLEVLDVKKGERFIDATFGEGGHSSEIAKLQGEVLAIDWDKSTVENIDKQKEGVKLVYGNFKDIERIAFTYGFMEVDGILFDLGISMEQLKAGKGLSYKKNDALDMRIDMSMETTAEQLLNNLSEYQLKEMFVRNSEELYASEIAQRIVHTRKAKPITHVNDLLGILDALNIPGRESTLKRVFQALRIEVNEEFDNLKQGLEGALNVLKPGGKLLVITFHSLEDRVVKQFINRHNLKTNPKKPIVSHRDLSFEKTAKLRVIEK